MLIFVFLFFWRGWRNNSPPDFGTSFSSPKCRVGTGLAAVGIPIKWIEHTLSLFLGSQAVLSLFPLFKTFIHNFLFSPFFKTRGKQYRANVFSQSLQFPLVMQLPGWWWASQISRVHLFNWNVLFVQPMTAQLTLAWYKSVNIRYKFKL